MDQESMHTKIVGGEIAILDTATNDLLAWLLRRVRLRWRL